MQLMFFYKFHLVAVAGDSRYVKKESTVDISQLH